MRAVLLADCRTGGSALRDTLMGHPGLRVMPGEPLDPKLGHGPLPAGETHSRATWDAFYASIYAGHDLWHLQRYQISRSGCGWQALAAIPGLRVIALHREDTLAQYASWRLALATGAWRRRPEELPRLQWNQEEYDSWCYTWQCARQYTEGVLGHATVLRITHEELCADFGGVLYRCQLALGLEPVPLPVAMARLPAVQYGEIFDGWPGE